ncbi:MAG: metalloregulator ArsR/SmtB family transcription factor [Myxococcales bacterium]|nr:metalloregulator ArsR/SmtB family transcription factor [Myxococcales bacterium]
MLEYIYLVAALEVHAAPRWELYRLLGEPVRLRLLALTAHEELTIGELADVLCEGQPNVSKHVASLRQAGLVQVRRQGTRALVRLVEAASADPVVADGLESGRALCVADGSLARLADAVRAREAAAREYFARQVGPVEAPALSGAFGAYVAALARLLPSRKLAVDAGTGDGSLLEVLAPAYEAVLAIDRSDVQLDRARVRTTTRGFENVTLLKAELDAPAALEAVSGGADVVFASRLLHHAARPVTLLRQLAGLTRVGGAVVVIDYGRHDDESMRDEADLWLGFEPSELEALAADAGLVEPHISPVRRWLHPDGRDAHLPWQILVAHRAASSTPARTARGTSSIEK